MKKLYSATFTDSATNTVIYRLNIRNPWNKFFWEKEKALQLERLSKLREIPKAQIEVLDTTHFDLNHEED